MQSLNVGRKTLSNQDKYYVNIVFKETKISAKKISDEQNTRILNKNRISKLTQFVRGMGRI